MKRELSAAELQAQLNGGEELNLTATYAQVSGGVIVCDTICSPGFAVKGGNEVEPEVMALS